MTSLVINAATWIWLLWNIRPQEQLIFLHYNILFGVDFLGAWWQVLTIPLAGLFILLINAFLGWMLYTKDSFVALLLNVTAVLVQVLSFVAAALLVFLNV